MARARRRVFIRRRRTLPWNPARLSGSPQIGLERFIDRRPRDAGSIVCDSGCRHDRDDLQRVLLAEPGCHECIDVMIVNASAVCTDNLNAGVAVMKSAQDSA